MACINEERGFDSHQPETQKGEEGVKAIHIYLYMTPPCLQIKKMVNYTS